MKSGKLVTLLTILALLTFAITSWAADGAALYKSNCAMCHKADASGNPAMKAPALKGKSSDVVVKTIDTNARHAALKKKLTPDQVKAIGDYIASLK